MLAHAYLDRVGAGQVFATVAGGPARRYDDLGVLSTAPPTIPRDRRPLTYRLAEA